MNNLKPFRKSKQFFETTEPLKITEGRFLEFNTECWGLLSDYHLESVKINWQDKKGESAAILRICDVSGQVSCIVKGPTVGRLFGQSVRKWREVEHLSHRGGQLFYRYFKDGIKKSFSFEQRLFYYFCSSNQCKDVLVAVFQRCQNYRNKDKDDAFLQITELRKFDIELLDLYQNHLRSSYAADMLSDA